MNPLTKFQVLSQPNPLSPGKGWDRNYALARALGLRRSRLGITEKLKRHFARKIAVVDIELPPYQAHMAYRVGDYGDVLALSEVFLGRIYDFAKVGVTPKLILDVGGHIGSFSVAAHHHFPDVGIIVFEPMAQSYALLTRNLKNNGINATTHNVAASNASGKLYMDGPSAVGATLSGQGSEEVDVVRISDHVDLGSSAPLLLKIDVEGAEWSIFEDILVRLPTDVFMFIEVHEGESSVYRLKHVLEPLGFRVYAPENGSHKGLAIDCYATRGVYSQPLPSKRPDDGD